MLGPAPLPFDAGAGPVVLLLHPFPLDHRAWTGAARALATGARVVVPDLAGFGAAPAPPAGAPASMDGMAQAVAAALDARGLRPALVAGNSMGGYVALALAELRPDLVPALALVDSRARADQPAQRERRRQQIAELEAAGPRAAALLGHWMLPRLLSPEAPPALKDEVRGWIRGASAEGAAAALAGMAARPDRTPALRGVARRGGPVLLVAGEQDPFTTAAEMEALAGDLRANGATARVVVVAVPGAGHLPQLEREAEVVAALRSVL